MLYVKGRLVSCVCAQSAEEALIKLDCTIGTLFSIVLVVSVTLIAKTKQSLHLAYSPPKSLSRYHAYRLCGAVMVPDMGLGYIQWLTYR